MAKASKRKFNRIDLENLSERDRDFLALDTAGVMKKYKMQKQSVYDRRFALSKKIREAGLSVEELLNGGAKTTAGIKKAPVKTTSNKKGRKPKQVESKPEEQQPEPIRDIVKYEKPVPVFMKPIEITFENFSVKLNGVPKKISVNPETNCI